MGGSPGELGSGTGGRQEFRNRHSGHRVNPVSRDFGQRLEHECPLAKARVGNDQSGFVRDNAAVQHEIEIQRTWTVLDGAHAAEPPFDLEERLEQIARRQSGDASRRGVEESRLIRQADGGRVVEC